MEMASLILGVTAIGLHIGASRLSLLVETRTPIKNDDEPSSWKYTALFAIFAVAFLSVMLWLLVQALAHASLIRIIFAVMGATSVLKFFLSYEYRWQLYLLAAYILASDLAWILWPNVLTANLYAFGLVLGLSATQALRTSFVRLSFLAVAIAFGYDFLHVFGTGLMVEGIGDIVNNYLPTLIAIPQRLSLDAPIAAILGIGDVIFPTILVVMASRIGRKAGHMYFFYAGVIGFIVGLGIAGIAVYGMGVGQPALIYLMPSVIVAIMLTAWRKQQFHLLREHGAAV